MVGKVIVLGCASSGGVPLIGNNWGVCDPHNPKDRRMRSSIFIQAENQNILVDTGPDLRTQLLNNNIDRINTVLFTHSHADHIFGMDELRHVYFRQRLPIQTYADKQTYEQIKKSYQYLFETVDPNFKPFLHAEEITGPISLDNLKIIPFKQEHGNMGSLGFRIGDFAYSTDMKDLDDNALNILEGVKVWIVEALKEEPHHSHSHLDHTLHLINKIKPQRAILTHMSQMMNYNDLKAKLPSGVEPAYDGMEIEVTLV